MEKAAHHEWENDGDLLDFLDDAQTSQAEELEEGEQVHSVEGHVSEEHVVRLVLGGHEQDQHPLHELNEEECKIE